MKLKLVDDWRELHKKWSVQIFILIAAFPEIYNGIAAMGWLDECPGPVKWTLRALAAAGVFARALDQKKGD